MTRFLDNMTIDQMRTHMDRLFDLAAQGHAGTDLAEYGRKVDDEIRRRVEAGES